MDNREIANRLRALGINRIPPQNVQNIVSKLHDGFSKASIYNEDFALASKATVQKIGRLYKDGQLDWILNEEIEAKELQELGQRLAIEDTHASQLDESKGPVIFRMPRGIDAGTIAGSFRTGRNVFENRFDQIVDEVPRVDWSLNTLLDVGMEESRALDILSRRDRAWELLLDKINYKTMHEVFSLHFLVDFYRSLNKSELPSHYTLEWAAEYYAEGLINDNDRIKKLIKGVIKYQAWRSDQHYRAMLESLALTNKEVRSIDKLKHYFQSETGMVQIYR